MNGRYLREPTGRSRREAVVTDRVRGRRSRAENARTRVALGRTGVSEKAVVPTNREIRFTALLTETTLYAQRLTALGPEKDIGGLCRHHLRANG
jgi:hypothetical protein